MKKIFLNWKQNGGFSQILNFKNHLQASNYEVVLFLPNPYLYFASSTQFMIGAQNVSTFQGGAYTGEVGADMLSGCGVRYCLIGHSERRSLFNEGEDLLKSKIKLLKQNGITPVLCVGESRLEREEGKTFKALDRQMSIYESGVLVAFEPMWAIGTGKTPTEEQILEVSKFLNFNYGVEMLYGGSVSSNNAKSILNIQFVSGVLVGGASLKIEEVNKIIQ